MSTIEANININVPDGQDPRELLSYIQTIITGLNDRQTVVNVVEVDDPLSLSPVQMKKIKE
jgi:hypothetical protein